MDRQMTIPIEKARELSPELKDALDAAEASGMTTVTIKAALNADGTYDVSVVEPDGAMIALIIPYWVAQEVALPGGLPAGELHITLYYLGDVADLSLEQQRMAIGIAGEVALSTPCLTGSLTGTGTFSVADGDPIPFWVGVDIPGLSDLQANLAAKLAAAGFRPSDYPTYNPHVTVMYLPPGSQPPAMDFAPITDIRFCDLTVCLGGQWLNLDLQDDGNDMEVAETREGWQPLSKDSVQKSVEANTEERYTLMPFYMPGQLDAHNEYTDAAELQKSFWAYMDNEDKSLRLQHNTNIVSGRRQDGMIIPYEWTVPMHKADGSSYDHTFPAGTPFLGVKWEPWAFRLFKEGKLNGLSIGGTSHRIVVDMDGQP